MVYSEIVRALPTRPDIKELQYSGARFSRGAIAKLGQRLQSRYPTHKFQILLPYENWKPGGWTSGNQPASLFSLLDHYDEAQLPDDADPDYFERFIIYVRDAPPVAGVNRKARIYQKGIRSQSRCSHPIFKKTKNSKSSFISVEKNRKTGVYETLEEAYQRIHEERNSFLQETKKFGLGIDLSYHNWSYKRTALWLFERLSVGIPANDPLDPIEAEWLSDAMMGGLIWADNEWKGYGRQRGKFQTLNDFVDHRGYALYGIIPCQNKEARIPGTVIFGEYVHFLFKIKNQGGIAGRVAKRVLNTLWGALCQRKRNYKTLTADQTDPFTFPEGPYTRLYHTNGFILEEQPDSPALFTLFRECRYDSKDFQVLKTAGYCHVKNANKVIWT
ncbi:hypothetical protein GLOIN_2v1472929 [Rhizophagus irregularis DAOM 181602=DAOM 197198]|nr:hypothetical protein GLOIN_2v1472929 [Rhizophagus irregularis DAOM 181602=DAOM 197198]